MRSRARPKPRSLLPLDLSCFYRAELDQCLLAPARLSWSGGEDFEVEFCEAILRRAPNHAEALAFLAEVYARRGDFARGLDADLRVSRIRPRSHLAQYNLACSYALNGQREPALDALTRAVQLGYHDLEQLHHDGDLASLREDPRFQALLRQLSGASARPGAK